MTEQVSWVAFDVDRIQDFVFASSRPVDVTGASELIKDLSEERGVLGGWLGEFKTSCKTEIIYSHGGSGLIKVHGDKGTADELARYLEQRFRKHTLTGSCTAVAYQPSWGVQNNPAGFQELLRVLGTKLQQRKGEKAAEEPPEPWVPSYFQRCQACGLYPAVSLRPIGDNPGEESEYICKSCDQKRDRGKEAKYAGGGGMPLMARTLEDIVGKETGERRLGYLAVIYADANNAGRLLLQAEDDQQVKAFSQWLWEAVEKSVGETACELGLGGRYQSPVVGGDDVLLFVPASHALEVLQSVQNKLLNSLGNIPSKLTSSNTLGPHCQKLSFSYALLIAPPHLPIPFLYHYAYSLLKSSKGLAYKEGSAAIDFQWITESSPLSESILELRRVFYRYRQDGREFPQGGRLIPLDEYWITAKPYKWEEFENLLKIVKVFRSNKVTKGQLRRLAQQLQDPSPAEAQLNVLYQAVRNEELAHALTTLSGSAADWSGFFFKVTIEDGKQVLRTRLLDILELFELQELAEVATPTSARRGGSV